MTDAAGREHRIALERVESEAWRDMVMAAPPEVAAALGLDVSDVGGALVGVTRAFDILAYNRAIGLGLTADAGEDDLDAILGYFRDQGIPRAFVQLHPDARPRRLAALLEERGLSHYNNWVKLHRSTDGEPAVDTMLRIERIDHTLGADCARIVTTAFEWDARLGQLVGAPVGRPGWWHYLAFDGDRPVSAASMFLAGEYAWFAFAATLPEARGRGAQNAMLARRLRDAREAGARWVSIETAEERPDHPSPSYRNVVRSGFAVAFVRPNFLWTTAR